MYDIVYCTDKIESVKRIIASLRNDEAFEKIWQKSSENIEEPARKKTTFSAQPNHKYKLLYFEIVDNLWQEIPLRFQSLRSLRFVELLDPKRAAAHRKDFPRNAFSSLLQIYGRHFDSTKLEVELRALYHSDDLTDLFPHDLHKMLCSTELFKSMTQVNKLCELISTVPTTTASDERWRSVDQTWYFNKKWLTY